MIPKLYAVFPAIGNGLGGLSDAIECRVEHEVNGIYELSMRYPITGEHYGDIASGNIVIAKPDTLTAAQPFRIYRITKPLNGVVTVYARHICYDMMGTIVEPFSAGSLTAAIGDLANHCTPATPFAFSTTRSVASPFSMSEPKELWRVLGGSAGSFLDVYGGEWDFDFLTAELKTRLGTDRGVNIRYGKNMTALEQDATIESTYSGVWPYWYDEENNTLVQISEKYVAVTGAAVTDRVLLLDCTDDFESQPSEQDLRDKANAFITANSVGDPKTSWRVSFVQLSQAGEYETQAALEQVMLGDTLHVYYEALGVNATARAVKIIFDVLGEKFIEITVGRVKQNLASIIVDQNKEVERQIATTKSALEQAVDRSTDFIKNGAGYMRLIYDSNDQLVEIVSLDNPDISLAQNVWRWNNGGFGFSNTGYNGTYGLALTQAGEIVADYITAGTMAANRVRTGLLEDQAGKWSVNLDTGYATLSNASIGGFTIDATSIRTAALTSNASGSIGISTADFTRTINGTSRSGLRLAIGSNFGVTNTGIIYASGVDISGSFNMTGGSVSITTSSLSDDRITLTYTGASGTTYTSTLGAVGFYAEQSSTNVKLSATARADGFHAYNAISSPTRHMQMSGTDVRLYDGSSVTRLSLGETGLTFYNSSGTQTAEYPSGGFSDYQATNVTTSATSGTDTNLATLTLQKGKYLIYAFVGFQSNTSGRRYVSISTSSTSTTSGLVVSDARAPATGAVTRVAVTGYAKPSAQTTYYLWCTQNSGSTLSINPLSMYAIKLP